MNKVNPPTQLVLPRKIQEDKELKKAFDDRDYILFQMWKRVGGGEDYIDSSQMQIEIIDDNIDVIEDDIEVIEEVIATLPTQEDIDDINARIDQLIELLTAELQESNIIAKQNGIKSLEQLRLLNNRFEEAFETKLTEADND